MNALGSTRGGGGGYVHGVGIPESEALCLQVSLRSSFLKTIMDGSAVSLGGRQFHKREVWKRNNDFDVVFALGRIILLGRLALCVILKWNEARQRRYLKINLCMVTKLKNCLR